MELKQKIKKQDVQRLRRLIQEVAEQMAKKLNYRSAFYRFVALSWSLV